MMDFKKATNPGQSTASLGKFTTKEEDNRLSK